MSGLLRFTTYSTHIFLFGIAISYIPESNHYMLWSINSRNHMLSGMCWHVDGVCKGVEALNVWIWCLQYRLIQAASQPQTSVRPPHVFLHENDCSSLRLLTSLPPTLLLLLLSVIVAMPLVLLLLSVIMKLPSLLPVLLLSPGIDADGGAASMGTSLTIRSCGKVVK